MKMLIMAGALALAALPASTALAQNAPPAPTADSRDRSYNADNRGEATLKPSFAVDNAAFFKDGAAGGLAEVDAGRLAEQQARDTRVRDFARQMVKDHSAANQELTALAKKKGVSLPNAPDGKHQQALTDLKDRNGADFDQAYIRGQLADHKDAVALFQTAEQSADTDVSAFARKMLPTLQHHLAMVQGLQNLP